jgi:hypothetical protein
MKALQFLLPVIILFVGISCKSDSEEPAFTYGTATIKIFKDNQMVAEYKDEEVVAMKDEDMLIINILSDDDDHILSISLIDPKKGNFPIDFNYESDGARVHLISTALTSTGDASLIIFPEGTVTVEEYSTNNIKGKIEANGLPGFADGVVFSISGTFTAAIVEI